MVLHGDANTERRHDNIQPEIDTFTLLQYPDTLPQKWFSMQKPDFKFVKDRINDAWVSYPAEDHVYLLESENYGIIIGKHSLSQL